MQDQESDPSQPLDPGPLRRARAAERAALLDGVLALSGERGYHRLTVERLADRAGIPVARFYLHFDDLGECFAAAYAERASALESALLGAGGEPLGGGVGEELGKRRTDALGPARLRRAGPRASVRRLPSSSPTPPPSGSPPAPS
jgi:AcrR family transcriptional regulator